MEGIVVYGSRYGATKETAEEIAKILRARARVEHGVEFRCIVPENITPPPDYKHPQFNMANADRYKWRFIEKVEAIIVLTEKKSIICLPDLSERFDYTGFYSNDPIFHKWCRDLFLYYWHKAKHVLSQNN